METLLQIILQIAVLLAVAFLFFTIKNLLPSYFNEKGKNIATKEDISEITELVEKTKQVFTSETEKLKATLLVVSNAQIGIISEERNAIIDLNEKYFRWLHSLIDTSLGEIDDYNNDELEKYRQKISQNYNDLLVSEAKFSLFVENKTLTGYFDKMKVETLTHLTKPAPTYILNLKKNNFEIEQMKKNTPIQEQSIKYSELLDKRREYYEQFTKEMIKGYEIIAPINGNFQKQCRDHIYQLIKQQQTPNENY